MRDSMPLITSTHRHVSLGIWDRSIAPNVLWMHGQSGYL